MAVNRAKNVSLGLNQSLHDFRHKGICGFCQNVPGAAAAAAAAAAATATILATTSW